MSKIKGAALITGASGRWGRAMAVDLAGLGLDNHALAPISRPQGPILDRLHHI